MGAATHIIKFTGQWSFLSNFHHSPVQLGGLTYPTVEHAFQAAKTRDAKLRMLIRNARSAEKAKGLGRVVPLRSDWEDVKLEVMHELLIDKFTREPERSLLIMTGDKYLVEGNTWGDTYWGQCPVGTGDNHLGLLLMEVRSEINAGRRG